MNANADGTKRSAAVDVDADGALLPTGNDAVAGGDGDGEEEGDGD